MLDADIDDIFGSAPDRPSLVTTMDALLCVSLSNLCLEQPFHSTSGVAIIGTDDVHDVVTVAMRFH